jgi:phage tail-like protein
MTDVFTGTHTAAAWETWYGRNVAVEAGRLRIATEGVPNYVDPELLVEDPPESFTPVALDVDDCGDVYILTAETDVYYYDHQQETLQKVACAWYPGLDTPETETVSTDEVESVADAEMTADDIPMVTASQPEPEVLAGVETARTPDPVDICVTNDTVYIADRGLPGVFAISKTSYQPRWVATDSVDSPVALVHHCQTGYLLDGGTGVVVPMTATGVHPEAVVEDLVAPVDLAGAPNGDLYVLDTTEPDDDGSDDDGPELTVRRFSIPDDGTEQFQPAGSVPVPDAYDPRCVEAPGEGGFIVGTGLDAVGETTPYRYLPGSAGSRRSGFERVASFKRPCAALALDDRPRHGALYAITVPTRADEPPHVYRLTAARPNRRNPSSGAFDASAWRRFDAGEPGIEWHRVTAGVEHTGPSTDVRLRYRTTDTIDVGTLEADFDITGPQAARLRAAKITGAWRLVEVGAADLAALCSIPEAWTEAWVEAGRDLVADTELNDITGIGQTRDDRLRAAGIYTPGDVLAVGAAELAEITEASVTEAETWLSDARPIVDAAVGDDWTTAIGIDTVGADQLAGAGVTSLSSLLSTSPTELAAALEVTPVETQGWVDRAVARLDLAWADSETATLSDPSDALLEGADGRYLWVAFELFGSEFDSPTVDTFRAYFPRKTYLDQLPAIYQADDASAAFLERFLSVFESTFIDIETEIGSVTRFLDAQGIPTASLPWLGEWLALSVDERWPAAVTRELLAETPTLYKQRGTRDGILGLLAVYLGDPPTVPADWAAAIERERADLAARAEAGVLTADQAAAESERLDRPAYLLETTDLDCIEDDVVRGLYEPLLGCPQCFLVLVPSFATDEAVDVAERLVDSSTPAHTVGRVVGLRPRLLLAGDSHPGHTYLGVNSRLADNEFLLEESTLGIDSALGAHEAFGRLELASRLDSDTVLS